MTRIAKKRGASPLTKGLADLEDVPVPDPVPGALYVDVPNADAKAALAAEQGQAEQLLGLLTVEAAPEQLGAVLQNVQGQIKTIDADRKKWKAPALNASKTIDGFFGPALKALRAVKAKTKTLLAEQAREADRVRREAMAEVAKGQAPVTPALAPVEAPAGVTYRDELVVEIDDFDKVPREFLVVDKSKLAILGKAGGEAPPGVRFRWAKKPIVGRV